MFKAFFRLWLVVFIPLFILVFPNRYSPLTMFNEYAEKSRYVDTFQGTFYLIEQQLALFPKPLWQEKTRQLATDFGYELTLISLAKTAKAQQEQLQAGQFVFINNEPERLLKRIADSQWAISMALDVTQDEEFIRSSSGTLSLLKQQIENLPNAQRQAKLDQLSANFHFALTLIPSQTLNWDANKSAKLARGELVWQSQEDGQLVFFQQLADQQTVLRAGAIAVTSVSPLLIIILLLMFVLVISLGMFLWVSPLWRDLNRLTATATDFGDGNLAQRAQVQKTPVLARLGHSFNSMADQIEHLILGHRELTNAIAHDLRTPLYRLRFAFEMLDDPDVSSREAEEYRHSINTSIDELDHLINQTLILSRYNRGTDLRQFSLCLLGDKISREITLFAQEHSNLELSFIQDPQLKNLSLFVDARAMIRALNNLLANAGRYAASEIRVSLARQQGTCLLTVEDDGPGIKTEEREKIFQPFAQLENQQRDTACGHGLGLAIVRKIAAWHKGEVYVADAAQGGAKFVLQWPIELTEPSINDK